MHNGNIDYRTKLVYQFIRFALVGAVGFILDGGGYFLLTRFGHVQYIEARSISLSTALIWNFLLNRHWTFQAFSGKAMNQFMRFLTVMLSTSLFSFFMTKIAVDKLSLPDMPVLIFLSILVACINFFLNSIWSYKQEN